MQRVVSVLGDEVVHFNRRISPISHVTTLLSISKCQAAKSCMWKTVEGVVHGEWVMLWVAAVCATLGLLLMHVGLSCTCMWRAVEYVGSGADGGATRAVFLGPPNSAGVTGNPIRAYTDPGGSDPLAESIECHYVPRSRRAPPRGITL